MVVEDVETGPWVLGFGNWVLEIVFFSLAPAVGYAEGKGFELPSQVHEIDRWV